jgi:cell wall-associated NlpC family hydrolase
MKTTTISNLLLTSSILFFSACSSTALKIKKSTKKNIIPSLSTYNIIGIERGKSVTTPLFVFAKNPKKTFNLIKVIPERQPIETINPYDKIEALEEVEYVDNTPPPIYNNTSYANAIEVISYAPTHRENRNIYSPNIEVISYGSRVAPSFPSRTHHTSKDTKDTSIIKNEIESKAKSFLGTKYVWGATGPSKFDCSGFTQWVYRDSGITIPRVSKDQAKVGNYVQYANLKRGDMVFFDTKKHRKGIVTHVGIYLGNNNFIHASSAAKKVVIYNFEDKPFYKERFLWGRRVINNNSYLASK